MSRASIPRQLPKQFKEEIDALISHYEKLADLMAIADGEKAGISISELAERAAANTDVPARDILMCWNALRNLSNFVEKTSRQSVVDLLERHIKDEKKSKKTKIEIIMSAVDAYVGSNPVSQTFKAQKLMYLHEKIFHEGEIITEARPVYSEDAKKILQMIVTHSLVCTYTDASIGSELCSIHLTMDGLDVVALRDACERAIVKSATLKQALEKESGWNVVVVEGADEAAKG